MAAERAPRLLLHICCAPCGSAVLERLAADYDITLRYYNPNISPGEEYFKRGAEIRRLLDSMPLPRPVELQIAPYDPAPFLALSRGLEDASEGGERCAACYRLRLTDAARAAREGAYDLFCTTLSVSPYKNAQKLNAIGREIAEQTGVDYLPSDFKKKNGYLRSCQLSRDLGLYRQPYCGCEFSRLSYEKRRAEKAEQEKAP